jgi:hypothetical protein
MRALGNWQAAVRESEGKRKRRVHNYSVMEGTYADAGSRARIVQPARRRFVVISIALLVAPTASTLADTIAGKTYRKSRHVHASRASHVLHLSVLRTFPIPSLVQL